MKIFSENSCTTKWIVPLVVLIIIGCFSLGLLAARFGVSAPLARPGDQQSATPIPPTVLPVAPPLPTQQSPTIATSEPVPRVLPHHPSSPTAPTYIASATDHVPKPNAPLPPIEVSSKIKAVQETFGHSVQERPLTAYVLGNGANRTMIFGDFHGNERSVPGVVNELRQYLEQHPERWHNCRIILVPYVNPDGWAAGTRVNAHQVDINRNFPGTWKAVGRAARYNPGPRAGSEPETMAIEGLVERCNPTKIVSIHQPLHMLNWTGLPGKKLAAVMHKANGYHISDDVGYATPGSFGDYCGGKGGKNIAIVTMELPNEGVSEAWAENREALLAAINAPIL